MGIMGKIKIAIIRGKQKLYENIDKKPNKKRK